MMLQYQTRPDKSDGVAVDGEPYRRSARCEYTCDFNRIKPGRVLYQYIIKGENFSPFPTKVFDKFICTGKI
jgi:hypothetical protein